MFKTTHKFIVQKVITVIQQCIQYTLWGAGDFMVGEEAEYINACAAISKFGSLPFSSTVHLRSVFDQPELDKVASSL